MIDERCLIIFYNNVFIYICLFYNGRRVVRCYSYICIFNNSRGSRSLSTGRFGRRRVDELVVMITRIGVIV